MKVSWDDGFQYVEKEKNVPNHEQVYHAVMLLVPCVEVCERGTKIVIRVIDYVMVGER